MSRLTRSAADRRFLAIVRTMPLGRVAEQRCDSIARARRKQEAFTIETVIDFLETYRDLVRQTQREQASTQREKAIVAAFDAAQPLVRMLAASNTSNAG
jgi:hypothetical protein